MKRIILAGVVLTVATIAAGVQHISADDLARRSIERRAVEAVNWGHAGRQLRPDAAKRCSPRPPGR
jgi:hypothetical protein